MSFYRYTESMKCGVGCDPGQTINLTFGFLWIIWGLLWLEGFLEINCKLGFLTKIKAFPILSILEGVLATGFVGLLMLINHFPL
jgi:hypothetical protein